MSIKKLKAKIDQLKEQMQKEGKDLILEDFRDFFKKNPKITAIGWVQYTPHFNDGEPCEFSVHQFGFTTAEDPLSIEYTCYNDSDANPAESFITDSWRLLETQKMLDAVGELESEISDDDLFKIIFGPDCSVIVTRDLEIEVGDWSHD